jgi:hypothetical protein
MKGRCKEAIGSGETGQETEETPSGRTPFVTMTKPHPVGA